MKEQGRQQLRSWLQKGKKYRYVLLVLLAGLVLMCLPVRDTETHQEESIPAVEESTGQVEELEERLAQALSRIDGVGEATVVLTLASGSRQVYATDTNTDADGGRSESVVVISAGSGSQTAVEVMEISPTYQGALVVCQGGDSAQVRLQVTESVAALTGLSMDKISVCAGK